MVIRKTSLQEELNRIEPNRTEQSILVNKEFQALFLFYRPISVFTLAYTFDTQVSRIRLSISTHTAVARVEFKRTIEKRTFFIYFIFDKKVWCLDLSRERFMTAYSYYIEHHKFWYV